MIVFVNRFCHPDLSATSQILSDLAETLAASGLPVTLVASRQKYDDPKARLAATEEWRGVAIRRVATTRFGRARLWGRALDYLSFYGSLPLTLWSVLRRGDVVVAKTDPPLVSLVVALVARLRGAVLVNWLQDVFPEVAVNLGEPPVPRVAASLLRRLRNLSLRLAVRNVAIGERMAEYLVGQGAPPERVLVIPNWAHEDAIRPLPAAESALRSGLGWQGVFVVGYSGNLGRAHDVDTLLDAMRRLDEVEAVGFLITGGGHGYERLKRECRDLARVRFLPYQPLSGLADSMAAADLHVVSLRPELEGQIVPSKFYGIAAAERPVAFIGDPDGELARLVAESHCGFSVAPGQGAALSQGILALAANRGLALEQGRRARDLLQRRFSRAGAQAQWLQLLQRLHATRGES